MNKQKISVLRIANCLRTIILFFCFSFMLVACNNADNKSKAPNTVATEISQTQKEELSIDTKKLQIEKPDSLKETPQKEVSKLPIKRESQIRESEGISDAKLNGETILLQEELSEKILASNPDTIKNYLKGIYLGQERNFPRSIADNFEQGISTEHISYPKLNYRVELFEDEYSKKPYKILGYSARKENEITIIE